MIYSSKYSLPRLFPATGEGLEWGLDFLVVVLVSVQSALTRAAAFETAAI